LDEGYGRRGAAPAAKVPPWIGLALIGVLALQVLQLGVSSAALVIALRAPAPAPAAPVVTTQPADPFSVPSAAPAVPPPVRIADAPPLPEAPDAAASPSPAASPASVATAPASAAAPGVSAPASGTARSPATSPATAGASAAPAAKPGVSPAPDGGLVLLSGAQAYLMGPNGRVPLGGVPAGTYELFVQSEGAEFTSQGTFPVAAGERVVWKCGLGTCKRLQ
jgi:hypothetical protein